MSGQERVAAWIRGPRIWLRSMRHDPLWTLRTIKFWGGLK